MKVGTIARKGNSRAAYPTMEMSEAPAGVSAGTVVDAMTAEELGAEGMPVGLSSDCDLVVSIDDDGTSPCAARGADGTLILGINLDEVGFLNAASPADAIGEVLAEVAAFQERDQSVREVLRIAASSNDREMGPSMNEIAVHGPRRGYSGGTDLEVRVDGSPYSRSHADGVLVTTLAGGSAYNLSGSDPLVHPGVEGLAITEMAAGEGMPPLVVPQGAAMSAIAIDAASAAVADDGWTRWTVPSPTEARIERSDLPVRLVGSTSDFFETLGRLD